MMQPEDDTFIMPPFQSEYWLEGPILDLAGRRQALA